MGDGHSPQQPMVQRTEDILEEDTGGKDMATQQCVEALVVEVDESPHMRAPPSLAKAVTFDTPPSTVTTAALCGVTSTMGTPMTWGWTQQYTKMSDTRCY